MSAPAGLVQVMEIMTATCAVCGEVACERALYWVDSQQSADRLSLEVGDCVCHDCA